MLDELRQILPKGTPTPAQAAKFLGRLGRSQSLMFGRYGRARGSRALPRGSIRGNSTKFHPIGDDLRATINSRVGIRSTTVPRKVYLGPKKPMLIYVDASGPGHLGIVVFCDGSAKACHTHLPPRFPQENGIYEFEICDMIYGLLISSPLKPGRPILLCGDNSGAVAALVRGNCATKSGKRPAAVFWAISACYGAAEWIEEFRTNFNISGPLLGPVPSWATRTNSKNLTMAHLSRLKRSPIRTVV